MSEVLAPLEDLPATTRSLMAATLRSGQHLMAESAESVQFTAKQSGSVHSLWAIRRAALDLRFLVAREGEEVFFFFVKRQLPTVRPLSARLQACISASADASPQESALRTSTSTGSPAGQPIYRLQVPSFLFLHPSPSELAHYAPPGTTKENGVLFRLGKDHRYILGVCNPDAGIQAKVSYQAEGEPAKLLQSWRVEPFLDLIETLREWTTGTQKTVQEQDLELPRDPTQMSDVHVTLHWFVEGFLAMEAAQWQSVSADSVPQSSALALVTPTYRISSYSAEIALAVSRSGRFATSPKQDVISLGMNLQVQREQGSLIARIALEPPDFLCKGTLRESFLETLRRSVPKPLRMALGMADEAVWTDYLDSARPKAVVFRILRDGSSDQDAVVLHGVFEGRPRTLIIRTRAVVDLSVQPPRVELSKISAVYDSASKDPQTLDAETVTYFMRLASALMGWLSIL